MQGRPKTANSNEEEWQVIVEDVNPKTKVDGDTLFFMENGNPWRSTDWSQKTKKQSEPKEVNQENIASPRKCK